MKGFEIYYNERKIKVAVKDGITTINIFNNNDDGHFYINGVDFKECKRYIWNDLSPIKIGDKFIIKVTEIDIVSEPAKTTLNIDMKRPKTKLEVFRDLEDNLIERGLI